MPRRLLNAAIDAIAGNFADDDDLVMRSVYLLPSEDNQLRQLAHELNVTKSDLIRSAISVKLRDWYASNSNVLVLQDLQAGQGPAQQQRIARAAAKTRKSAPPEAPLVKRRRKVASAAPGARVPGDKPAQLAVRQR